MKLVGKKYFNGVLKAVERSHSMAQITQCGQKYIEGKKGSHMRFMIEWDVPFSRLYYEELNGKYDNDKDKEEEEKVTQQ